MRRLRLFGEYWCRTDHRFSYRQNGKLRSVRCLIIWPAVATNCAAELRILRTRPPIGGFLGRMHDVPGTRTWCGLVPASGASRDPDCPGAPIDSSPAASQDRSPGEDLHEAHPWRHVGELSGQGDFRRCMTGACATFRRRRVRARPPGRGEPRRSRGSGPQAQRNSAPPGQDASTGPPDGLRRRHGTVPH